MVNSNFVQQMTCCFAAGNPGRVSFNRAKTGQSNGLRLLKYTAVLNQTSVGAIFGSLRQRRRPVGGLVGDPTDAVV